MPDPLSLSSPAFPPVATSAMAASFLRIAQSGARLATRQDLADWLAGAAQELLPHRTLVVADTEPASRWVLVQWSDPVASAPRSEALAPLAQAWVASRGGQWPPRPCRIDLHSRQPAPLGVALAEGAVAAWVHGMPLAPSGRWRLFVVLERMPVDAGLALELLAPFVDAALRRGAGLGASAGAAGAGASMRPIVATMPSSSLSERERQIMTWVAMGKTNPEIGCILRISEFTVKNHLKSIFGKLDVSNRAQAVAKLTGSFSHA